MKIVITEGCTAFDTKIDGISTSDMSKEQLEKAVEIIVQNIRKGIWENTSSLNSAINIMEYDEYKNDNCYCEQCGDSVSTTIWNI